MRGVTDSEEPGMAGEAMIFVPVRNKANWREVLKFDV